MSERARGSTSVSLEFRLTDVATGEPATGLVVTALTLQYHRPREAPGTATALTLLAAHTTAWAAHGAREVDAAGSPGVYRVDAPDAAFAAGADEVTLTVAGAAIQPATRLLELTTPDAIAAAVWAAAPASTPLADLAAAVWDAAPAGPTLIDFGNAVRTELAPELGDLATIAPVAAALDLMIVTDGAGAYEYTAGALANAPTGGGGGGSDTPGTTTLLARIPGTVAAQSGDAFARLGAPAGASHAADTAAVKADTAAVKLKTDNLPASPAAVGSNMGTVASVTAAVSVNLAQTGFAPRALDAIADGALTLGDVLIAGLVGGVGDESVVGLNYLKKTPSTNTTVRSLTLDDSENPTSRT